MSIDDAIAELTFRIKNASPDAVVRVMRRSGEGLDVQVLLYDSATSLPPAQPLSGCQ